jgi:hypothetical protein
MSTADLQEYYLLEIWDPNSQPDYEVWAAARCRSVSMSMGRALRQLEAAGQIKRDNAGDWYPWAERERSATAYHEAGHAVVGLALQLPVAFVTIKPKKSYLGRVSLAPMHHSVGHVYARGSWEPIADMTKEDAFGNPVSECNVNWHASAVMSIAGGMAEAEFLKDDSTGHEHASSNDKLIIRRNHSMLGDKARSVEEYEAECAVLIKRHWPLIEAVATKLLKEETLSGSDVYDICLRTRRNVVRRQHLKDQIRRN